MSVAPTRPEPPLRGIVIHGAWALAVLVAFVLGYRLATPSRPAGDVLRHGVVDGRSAEASSTAKDAAESNGTPPVGLNEDEADALRGEFFGILEDPNHLTRLRRTLDFLGTLDATSWAPAFQALTIETVQTGRRHDMEWKLMVQLGGELCGQQVMERFQRDKKRVESKLAIAGWASVDPEAARAWVEALPHGEERSTLLGDLVDGMVQKDANAAAALLDDLPPGIRAQFARPFIEGVIQSGGYAAATAALGEARRLEGEKEEEDTSYTTSLFDTIADRLLFSNWSAKTPNLACRWISENARSGEVGPKLMKHAAGDWAKLNPPSAFLWVESMTDRVDDGTVRSGIDGVLDQWMKNDAPGVGVWLASNEGRPLVERAADVYLARLIQSDLAAAEAWVKTIKDPERRTQAEEVVEQQKSVLEAMPR